MPHARPNYDAVDLELFLAEWTRGRLSPDDAVRRAVGALEAGCDHPSVAVVAGLTAAHPTLEEVELEIDRLLRHLGRARPSADAALKTLVDDCARRIADGRIEPTTGAWELFDFTVNEDESAEFLDQLRALVDLVCDWSNAGEQEPPPRGAIVTEAQAFLARGGLAPMPGNRG